MDIINLFKVNYEQNILLTGNKSRPATVPGVDGLNRGEPPVELPVSPPLPHARL